MDHGMYCPQSRCRRIPVDFRATQNVLSATCNRVGSRTVGVSLAVPSTKYSSFQSGLTSHPGTPRLKSGSSMETDVRAQNTVEVGVSRCLQCNITRASSSAAHDKNKLNTNKSLKNKFNTASKNLDNLTTFKKLATMPPRGPTTKPRSTTHQYLEDRQQTGQVEKQTRNFDSKRSDKIATLFKQSKLSHEATRPKPRSKPRHCDSKRHDNEETGAWLVTSMASQKNNTQLNTAPTLP